MERKAILILLALTLITRIAFLDARPMDHDESVHAYLSYDLLVNHRYSYDPAYHGPFLYFFTAGVFWLFGDSDFTSRFLPVLFSFVGIFFAYRFRRWMGEGVYIFLFLMLFSASILYYSRYLRNDITVLSSFIALVYCYLRFGENRYKYAALSSIFLAIMVCSKENAYIYIAILTSFILLYGLYSKGVVYLRDILFSWDKEKVGAIVIFFAIFLAIFSTLYTAGFSDMDGFRRATIGAVEHWFTMHSTKDHAKHPLYYAALLLRYEFLPVTLAIVSIIPFYRKFKTREAGKIELFSAYWLVTTLTAYQILSHKVPWLLVHLVAPMAFFASVNLKNEIASWQNRGLRAGIVLLSVIYLVSSLHITYIDYTDATEGLIYIQVQPSAVELAEKIIERETSGIHGLVFETHNDYWPLPWYLRHIEIPFSNRLYGKFDYYVTSEINAPLFKSCSLEGRYEIRPGYYMVLFEKCQKIG
jgi:uncharacterized protein (TIGR03663 family)